LVHLYSLGQVAPGPNMMMVAAIGERVAGLVGGAVVGGGFFGATGGVALGGGRVLARPAGGGWGGSPPRGLAPVSVGLLVAGAISLAKGALTGWHSIVISVAVFILLLRTRINPALLVLCGAVTGLVALR